MSFITFMYKIGRNPNIFYGKLCEDYISDDHEGLDTEVRYKLLKTINRYRKLKNSDNTDKEIELLNDEDLKIGVISFSSNKTIPTYSSDKEIQFFDYYKDYDKTEYINGSPIL